MSVPVPQTCSGKSPDGHGCAFEVAVKDLLRLEIGKHKSSNMNPEKEKSPGGEMKSMLLAELGQKVLLRCL